MFFTKTTEVLYFIRKTLQLTNYEEALDAIMKERLTTSAYYTIGGTFDKGGCVVERSSGEVHNQTCLGPKGADPWFIVQTNYDRNLVDPSQDFRRYPVEAKIKALGQ